MIDNGFDTADADVWKVKEGWNLLGSTVKKYLDFKMSCMLEYFINRKAIDGLCNNEFKTLNKAYPLFKAGHIQCVF